MKFYKVVKREGKGLISCRSVSISDELKKYIIHYRTQRWVKPKIPNSKIFIFNSLKAAKRFVFDDELIYECEAKNPQIAESYSQDTLNILDYWNKKYTPCIYEKPPEGTYYADAVKLIKRIK